MERIGIVGVGGMGGGIADRLLDEGVGVTLWNRTGAALDRYRDRQGAEVAGSPAEAAACKTVISFVADDAALRHVTLGPSGILAGLPEGGIHVSMSSVSPEVVTELAREHAAVGRAMVAAPVFGRPEAAAKGLLWIALAGEGRAREAVRPALKRVSRSIHHFGDDPAAALGIKLAGNFLIAAAIEAMSEAFAALEARGYDARAFHAMMSDSVFASVIHQNYGRIILDGAFHPPGFKLSLGAKDVGLFRDLAGPAGAMPFAEILRERFAAGMDSGDGDADWNAISRALRP